MELLKTCTKLQAILVEEDVICPFPMSTSRNAIKNTDFLQNTSHKRILCHWLLARLGTQNSKSDVVNLVTQSESNLKLQYIEKKNTKLYNH
jgi:hypothetical protein